MFPLGETVTKALQVLFKTGRYGSVLVQNQQHRHKKNIQNAFGRFSSIFIVDLELLKFKTFKVIFLLFS